MIIFYQCHGFFRSFQRQVNMLLACDNFLAVRFIVGLCKRKQCTYNSYCCLIDLFLADLTVAYSFNQLIAKIFCMAHFNIHATICGFNCIFNSPCKVAYDKTIKIPLTLQNLI
ncbi:hypothetical protein D3C81_1353410 [compost metagenome]